MQQILSEVFQALVHPQPLPAGMSQVPDPHSWTGLAEVARRAIEASRGRSVSEPSSDAGRAAVHALTEAIIADGIERETAEYAVTRWMITTEPIEECVHLETEAPGPRRHRQAVASSVRGQA